MSHAKRTRRGFRPEVAGATLEERNLLAASSLQQVLLGQGVTAYYSQQPLTVSQYPYAQLGVGGQVSAAQTNQSQRAQELQFRRAYLQELRNGLNNLRDTIRVQTAQLYLSGRPTPAQLTAYRDYVSGAVDALALRLSSQLALLPNSEQLVANVQNQLLGPLGNGLSTGLLNQTYNGRLTSSFNYLDRSLGQQLTRTTNDLSRQLNTYFARNSLARNSIDPTTGQAIPIQQYLGNRLINQLGNTLGTLQQNFGNVANPLVFPNGATVADPTGLQQFNLLTQNALNTAAFQVGSALSVFPNASTITPQLLNTFFVSPTGEPGVLRNLQNLPTTVDQFGPAANAAFTNGFSGLTTPLAGFFGLPASSTFNLPAPGSEIPGVFGPSFSSPNFNSGFNSGFGLGGFPGFGLAPSGFNTGFSSGFNGLIGAANPALGFGSGMVL